MNIQRAPLGLTFGLEEYIGVVALMEELGSDKSKT